MVWGRNRPVGSMRPTLPDGCVTNPSEPTKLLEVQVTVGAVAVPYGWLVGLPATTVSVFVFTVKVCRTLRAVDSLVVAPE